MKQGKLKSYDYVVDLKKPYQENPIKYSLKVERISINFAAVTDEEEEEKYDEIEEDGELKYQKFIGLILNLKKKFQFSQMLKKTLNKSRKKHKKNKNRNLCETNKDIGESKNLEEIFHHIS